MIPYGRQSINAQDKQAVLDVLASDWLTQGSVVPRFEQALCAACQAPYSVVVSHATAALHLACRALQVGPGDWVWTSPITFVASANCALYCGAGVDFVDIDPDTMNMCVNALTHKLVQAQRQGCLPKVVIPVHFAGRSCDMENIHRLSEQYGFRIIEDAAHAIGGQYHNAPIGCCRYSDIVVFSFHPVKMITTGEGGALMTRDAHLHETLQLLRSHGVTKDPACFSQTAPGDWYYEQIDLGYNYRMTELQAALGCSQLQRLATFVRTRTQLAQRYHALLAELPVRCPHFATDGRSAWHLYVVQIDNADDRAVVFQQMRAADIGVQVHYIPVHLQPYYQRMGFAAGDFAHSERYYQQALTLPLFVDLTPAQQQSVIRVLAESLHRCG